MKSMKNMKKLKFTLLLFVVLSAGVGLVQSCSSSDDSQVAPVTIDKSVLITSALCLTRMQETLARWLF